MTVTEPILQVAVPVPVRHLFDYLPPPPGPIPPVRPGMRVRVPFGRTSAVGVVIGTAPASTVDAKRLKRVREVIDPEPLVDPAMLKLLLWASGYFQHPVGEVVVGTLPRLLRLGRAPKAERTMRYAATTAGAQALASGIGGAPVQSRLLGLMAGAASVAEAQLAAAHRDWRRPMRALIAKGWAEPVPDVPHRSDRHDGGGGPARPVWSDDQQREAGRHDGGGGPARPVWSDDQQREAGRHDGGGGPARPVWSDDQQREAGRHDGGGGPDRPVRSDDQQREARHDDQRR